MSDDPLDGEVSVSAELTPTGVKAAAKSRIIAAIDRLGGNLVEALNAPLDRRLRHDRAVGEANVRFVEKLGEMRLDQLHQDPDFAAKAIEQHYKTAVRRQENKATIVTLALEDLRDEPPTEQQNVSGPEALTDEFLNRFERYAEDATADQVRERWARVLASEIRQPGTFSARVMRVVDEIEPATALLFERVCQARIQNLLIPCLMDKIDYLDQTRLVSAELVVDIGLGGQLRQSTTANLSSGEEIHFISVGIGGIGFASDLELPKHGITLEQSSFPIVSDGSKPSLPVYILTDVGHAISSILQHDEVAVFDRLVQKIAEYMEPRPVQEFRSSGRGGFALTKTWNLDTASNPSV